MNKKKMIAIRRSSSVSFSSPKATEGVLRVEKLSVTLTLVSEGGKEATFSFSGDAGAAAASSVPEPTGNGDVLPLRPGAPLSEVEEAYIRIVLSRSGNKKRASAILGISPHTLSNRLRAFEERRAKAGAGSPQK